MTEGGADKIFNLISPQFHTFTTVVINNYFPVAMTEGGAYKIYNIRSIDMSKSCPVRLTHARLHHVILCKDIRMT